MSDLLAHMQGDLNAARKSQDKAATLLLSTVLADIKNKRIELRRDPTDDDIIAVLRSGIKRRRDSVDMYTKGSRIDLASKEQGEIDALQRYLPAQVSEDEIRTAAETAIAGGATSMGPLMGALNTQFKGRTEGSVISKIAKEVLAAHG